MPYTATRSSGCRTARRSSARPSPPIAANRRSPRAPGTRVWVEALDEGDPRKKVPHRDRVLSLATPFAGEPKEVIKVEHRFAGLSWGERDGLALIRDYDRDRRWSKTYAFSFD